MYLIESLFELRRSKGLSQEDLASQIGVSRQAVSKWETGEAMPDLNKLLLLADALEVSLDCLCGKEKSLTESLPTAPTAKKKRLWSILCGVLAILVVLLLLQTAHLYKETKRENDAPMQMNIAEAAFYSSTGHTLRYRIIPSEICADDDIYKLLLTPETPVAGAPAPITLDAASGIFQGELTFPLTASRWTVALQVERREKTYIVPVATDLRYRAEGLVSWEPVTYKKEAE